MACHVLLCLHGAKVDVDNMTLCALGDSRRDSLSSLCMGRELTWQCGPLWDHPSHANQESIADSFSARVFIVFFIYFPGFSK